MSTPPPAVTAAAHPRLHRLMDSLQEALLEVDVWRRHARHTEEWVALRRIASMLAEAREELVEELRVGHADDPLQGNLLR